MKTNAVLLLALTLLGFDCMAVECNDWQNIHQEWIWCDDFENDSSLENNYFEVVRANGRFGVAQENAFDGNSSLKATYIPGSLQAGNVKFSFGKTLVAPTRYTVEKFNEIYWRFYVLHEAGWLGNPAKLTRAMVFSKPDWSQAAIGHLWENSSLGLKLDPASGVVGSSVVTNGYNDFNNLTWLGGIAGNLEIYAQENTNKWHCIEVHMALNTSSQANGIFEFWINDTLQGARNDLNWRGSYTDYGINAIFLENYSNNSVPQEQSRFIDNFVVSRERIGCEVNIGISRPNPPSNLKIN